MVPVNEVVLPSGGKILLHSEAAMNHLLSVQRLGSPSCAGHQQGATVPAGELRDHHSVVPYSVGVHMVVLIYMNVKLSSLLGVVPF